MLILKNGLTSLLYSVHTKHMRRSKHWHMFAIGSGEIASEARVSLFQRRKGLVLVLVANRELLYLYTTPCIWCKRESISKKTRTNFELVHGGESMFKHNSPHPELHPEVSEKASGALWVEESR